MLRLAEAADWDALARAYQTTTSDGSGYAQLMATPAQDREITEILRETLANVEATKALVALEMRALSVLIDTNANKRKLSTTYAGG